MPDPSDNHRFMLIGYIAETDKILILRRAEQTNLSESSSEHQKGEIDD
ncbi:MAG: hypothetical protein V1920_00750 [Bacillota bacterium]